VPPIDPGDQRQKYLTVNIGKGLLRHLVTVVVGPAPQLAIELPDQFLRFGGGIRFDQCSNFVQEAFYGWLGGLNQ